MHLSVVLPTHNRPGLMPEAVASVTAQTWFDWELILVDDGSTPPASQHGIGDLGARLVWLRNDPARGLSGARNRGMEAATGDVITFLDDDDLFAPDMLESIVQVFTRRPELECLFVNIDPFGDHPEGMRSNQTRSLASMLGRLSVQPSEDGVVVLGPQLFEAMLGGLPLAFQRVALRRSALGRTGLYQAGDFGDLEWNFRLALRCHCALLLRPLYRVRCDGQSFFTRGEARSRLNEALIRIYGQLGELPEVLTQPRLQRALRGALAKTHFEKAYLALESRQSLPWKSFVFSMRPRPAWRHVSLLLRWCLQRMGFRRSFMLNH